MSNKKILIVEDDADVRLGYQVLLKANHYDTFFAADSSSWRGSGRTRISR
jgi:CheY-like chemotaxis protein